MHRFILTSLAITLSTPAFATLAPGAIAPNFETQAVLAGKTPYTYSLNKARKKGPVVLYFFPAAFTPGCTVEAHEFAEAVKDFHKLGATVIGAAGDDIVKLSKFSKEECRNKFPVAIATSAMISGYDVALPMAGRTNRTSYIVAPNGQIIYAYSNMDYRGHVSGALAALKQWKAGQKR
jgi:thioredoxin-dependent peroxiredoxin